MNFFKFIVQQYKDYKIEKVTLHTRCDTCPCKTLRDGMFGTHKLRKECLQEMIYLLNKFKKIHFRYILLTFSDIFFAILSEAIMLSLHK